MGEIFKQPLNCDTRRYDVYNAAFEFVQTRNISCIPQGISIDETLAWMHETIEVGEAIYNHLVIECRNYTCASGFIRVVLAMMEAYNRLKMANYEATFFKFYLRKKHIPVGFFTSESWRSGLWRGDVTDEKDYEVFHRLKCYDQYIEELAKKSYETDIYSDIELPD